MAAADWTRLGPRPRALLVDLDDTIVTDSTLSEANWRAAVDAAAAVVAFPVAAVLDEIHRERKWYWDDPERHRTGRADLVAARREIVDAAVRRAGVAEPVATHVVVAIVAAYGARVEAARVLLPGSIEALNDIRALGIRLALVSNGAAEAQRAKVERFGLAPLFEAIVIEGEFGQGKPEPAIYAHALSLLGVAAGDAWINLEWDVAMPRRLGLRGILIAPEAPAGPGAEAIADAVAEAIDDSIADAVVPDLPALARLLASC